MKNKISMYIIPILMIEIIYGLYSAYFYEPNKVYFNLEIMILAFYCLIYTISTINFKNINNFKLALLIVIVISIILSYAVRNNIILMFITYMSGLIFVCLFEILYIKKEKAILDKETSLLLYLTFYLCASLVFLWI